MSTAYDFARADIGTWEWKDGHNPKVVQYFKDVGHDWVTDDETAWCAAFAGSMLKRAGLPHTGKLNARSYLDWGKPVDLADAQPGDIVIFWRGSPSSWKGHVGFFVRQEADQIVVLGGNQNNQVNEARYPRSRLLGVRRMKPLSKSRTVAGAAATGAGTAGTGALEIIQDAQDQVAPLVGYADTLKWVFLALAIAGIALTVYARLDDRKAGYR